MSTVAASVAEAVLTDPGGFREKLRLQVFAHGGTSFLVVSHLLGASYLLLVVLSVLGLWGRWRRGTLWLWKSALYRPNSSVVVQALFALYFGLTALTIYVAWFSTKPQAGVTTLQFLMFLPVGLAAWIQLWGTIAALPSRKALVTLPHSRKATNTFIRRKASKGSQLGRFALCLRLPSIRPSFANVLFVSIPPLMSITSFVVAEMAGKELAKLRETWSAADSLLATAASDGWTPAGLAAIRVALTQMQTIHFTLAKRLRMTAVLYVLWVSLDCVLNALNSSAPVETILLPVPPSTAAPPLQSPSLSRNSSISMSTTPLSNTTAFDREERNWHPAYEEELVAKVRKLERARKFFLINAVSTICASLAFLGYAIRLLASRFVGEITSLELHRYRVALLWWPAISFLVFCTPPTLLFLHISFTPSGVISTSTQTHPSPPPLRTPGYDADVDFAPASARPSVDSERSIDKREKRAIWPVPGRRKEAAGSIAARCAASERGGMGARIQLREAGGWSEGSGSASREGIGNGSGSGSGSRGTGSGRGAEEGREGMWDVRPSQWAEARVKEREGF